MSPTISPPLGATACEFWRIASATDVFGISTFRCAGGGGGGGPPTFSSTILGFSTVGGGGGTLEFVGGSSIFGGSFTTASSFGGSGMGVAAGTGCGGVGIGAGRCAIGWVVDGAALGICMRSLGVNEAMSISLLTLPLVGFGWVNSVSGSISGVTMRGA